MSDIPDARRRIAQLLKLLRTATEQLELVLQQMTREKPASRAAPERYLTRAQAIEIKRMKAADPKLPHHVIAKVVGTDIGRVSEVLTGKRFADD